MICFWLCWHVNCKFWRLLMSYLFIFTLKAKVCILSQFHGCRVCSVTVAQPLRFSYEQVSLSQTVDVSFSLVLQNHNVCRGGVSHHLSPPAQRQIRERSHQHRDLFVLFIKNWRPFSKLSGSLCWGSASIFSISLQRISCNDLICLRHPPPAFCLAPDELKT